MTIHEKIIVLIRITCKHDLFKQQLHACVSVCVLNVCMCMLVGTLRCVVRVV